MRIQDLANNRDQWKNAEECQRYLDSYKQKDAIPEKEVLEQLGKYIPDFTAPQISGEERKRRRAISERMHKVLSEYFVSDLFPKIETVRNKKSSLPREMQGLFLKSDTPEAERENREIDKILRGNDPVARAELVCKLMKPFNDMEESKAKSLSD